jgi:catechol 2,3-dioxygenase-like lactoylglutathione lyase family enzyme
MLDRYPIMPALPASDIERAKRFYAEKLGLTPESEDPGGVDYRSGGNVFYLYPTQFAGTAQHTLAGWEVDDIDKVVGELRGRGVVFEEYDLPGLKTQNGIAELNGERIAWFRDSEGSILAIVQP